MGDEKDYIHVFLIKSLKVIDKKKNLKGIQRKQTHCVEKK